MSWYLEVIKKYAVFDGRARRKEYWGFGLVNAIILATLTLIERATDMAPEINLNALASIFNLAILIPTIAVSVRRLHDTNHSGWWLLVSFVPFIGVIVLFVLMVRDSDPGINQYGVNPKPAAEAGAEPYTVSRALKMIALVILIAAIGVVSASLYLQHEAHKDYQKRMERDYKK